MTTLVVLQPGYLPWLGYFDLLRKADVFVHYDDVQFDKHGWRNRNRVKGPEGPYGSLCPCSTAAVPGNRSMRWRSTTGTVGAVSICRLSANLMRGRLSSNRFCRGCRIFSSDRGRGWSNWISRSSPGLRQNSASPHRCHRTSELGIGGDRNERLINLCRHFGATRYLSGNAALDYLDVRRFTAADIEVAWHDYAHPTYTQLHGAFVPYLSVLDLILNVGRDALAVLSRPALASFDAF